MADPNRLHKMFISDGDDMCRTCSYMLLTTYGLFGLITRGFDHGWIHYPQEPMSLSKDITSPCSTPPNPKSSYDLQLLGWGCHFCALVLSDPKASQKGSQVTHPSVAHKYVIEKHHEFRHIGFRAIIVNDAGEEVENPFRYRKFSLTGKNSDLLQMTEVVEYFYKHHLHVGGIAVERGSEVSYTVEWHVQMGSLYPGVSADYPWYRFTGVFDLSRTGGLKRKGIGGVLNPRQKLPPSNLRICDEDTPEDVEICNIKMLSTKLQSFMLQEE
ncbi:uncharacterized protein EAF01_010613 [Botrytis porri]|uniref:Uncharacterized protein n=1 Tax=Botrytis porri TaxID=87229 RepID=A0A4Z1K8S3_9HELO|nr:uncharacterized protein EAF01_010613 [Botrytis porri]KAF7890804.1 hypothetical protein EAF01_010613 [Botrytis porri]TGO81848.1 hypothetical protein BPOR_0995g00010 [Botrytis porri]